MNGSGRTTGEDVDTETLLARYRRRRSVRVRDLVVERHRLDVERMAKALALRLPRHIDCEDLVHAGVWGLLQAIDRYRADRGVPFRAFMRTRVRGAMLDELRNLDSVPRLFRRRQREVDEISQALRQQLEREPSEAEVLAAWQERQRLLDARGLGASTRASTDWQIGDEVDAEHAPADLEVVDPGAVDPGAVDPEAVDGRQVESVFGTTGEEALGEQAAGGAAGPDHDGRQSNGQTENGQTENGRRAADQSSDGGAGEDGATHDGATHECAGDAARVDVANRLFPFGLTQPPESRFGAEWIDELTDDTEHPIESLDRQDLIEQIRSSLQPMEWTVLKMHYLDGLSGKQIAESLSLSASRICQIHVRVLSRLKERLGQRPG